MGDRLKQGSGVGDPLDDLDDAVVGRLRAMMTPSLTRVINATGVVLHTNLGRAPLCDAAVDRIAALASGFTNLEYDLEAGARGRRHVHAERLLCGLVGAESALLVNNNAAAVLLCLAALAYGREVLISRGELVEIGGGFRVPDVMRQSGAVLREVGTTNRTRDADYAAAITDRTAMILRVHPSNFRIEGFTERPKLASLVALGRQFGIPVVDDLGSGLLRTPAGVPSLIEEPTVADTLSAGVDVVLFSGDKLFGGPQAGVIAGRTPAIATIRTHPLMRALRVDKLTYAAVEATLSEYIAGRAEQTVPVARMIALSHEDIAPRANRVAAVLSDASILAQSVDGVSTIGGGSAPGAQLPTRLVALRSDSFSPNALESALRQQTPPVIARIEDERVLFDLRTVDPAEDALLARLVALAVASASSSAASL